MESIKNKIHQMIDSIKDEGILQRVMEDVSFYTSEREILDDLTKKQIIELDEAITEVENNESIDWSEFKKEMIEWKKG